jgi:hypothetical protein
MILPVFIGQGIIVKLNSNTPLNWIMRIPLAKQTWTRGPGFKGWNNNWRLNGGGVWAFG